jgi:glycosyltransferase involved in cell wall biosynthesis
MDARSDSRVVLVHDWLTGMRGGEKCLDVLCRRWPDAPLFTLLHRKGSVDPTIEHRPIHTSVLQRLPRVYRYYRYLLPLMPAAAAGWKLPDCDLVVSLSHCVAKAALAPAGVPHVCYCFTPMRYAWHMRNAYFGGKSAGLKAKTRDQLLAAMRKWDRRTAQRVTHFIAISQTVQERIADCYGRDSVVIYPPVDTDYYRPVAESRGDYYLAISAFAPYKRLDLAIQACNKLGRHLVVIGTGQDERRLRGLAGPTIHFMGWQPNDVLREHLQRCKALLFPGEEDFGIVPVEANACGTPVIAFGKGGATETVMPADGAAEPTGVWFMEQTVESLVEAMERFEARTTDFSPAAARKQALRFNARRFADEIFSYLAVVTRSTILPARKAA